MRSDMKTCNPLRGRTLAEASDDSVAPFSFRTKSQLPGYASHRRPVIGRPWQSSPVKKRATFAGLVLAPFSSRVRTQDRSGGST